MPPYTSKDGALACDSVPLDTPAAEHGTPLYAYSGDATAGSHPYVSTGLSQSKFGVAIGEAQRILEHARALPGVRVVGVQCHIGSQIEDMAPLRAAAAALAALSRDLLARGFALETIDIGG